jgi:hypothetical protein
MKNKYSKSFFFQKLTAKQHNHQTLSVKEKSVTEKSVTEEV